MCMRACVYSVCMYACMCVCMHMCVCTCIVCLCVHIHTCVYGHVYVTGRRYNLQAGFGEQKPGWFQTKPSVGSRLSYLELSNSCVVITTLCGHNYTVWS